MALGLRLPGAGPLLVLVILAGVVSLLTLNFLKPGDLSNMDKFK